MGNAARCGIAVSVAALLVPLTPRGVMQRFDVRAEFQGSFGNRRKVTRFLVVHHAAALYRQASGIDDVRAIARYHTGTKGWGGIGYHIVLAELTNGNEVARYDVSDLDTQRAHVWLRNHEALGVCCATRFDGVPGVKWLAALGETLRELKERYPQAQIVGHTDIALPGYQTSCPGRLWPVWRPLLMAAVDNLATSNPPKRYRVTAPAGANVRNLPNLLAPKVGTVAHGAELQGFPIEGGRVDLAPFGHSSHWVRLADDSGYVWRNLLDELP